MIFIRYWALQYKRCSSTLSWYLLKIQTTLSTKYHAKREECVINLQPTLQYISKVYQLPYFFIKKKQEVLDEMFVQLVMLFYIKANKTTLIFLSLNTKIFLSSHPVYKSFFLLIIF